MVSFIAKKTKKTLNGSLWKGRKETAVSLCYLIGPRSRKPPCRSDGNLVGGAADASHLLHPAARRLVGGTLRQCRAGVSHSGPGGHADWVGGRGRGGAGGGRGGEGLAAVSLTQMFHLDQLIPDFKKK